MRRLIKICLWCTAGVVVVVFGLVLKVTLLPPAVEYDGYNYSSYRQIEADSERSAGPDVGQPFPRDATVFDLEGNEIPIATLWQDKPLVLEFGSASCPIFHGNGPSMEEIFTTYDGGVADQARIGLLYVREAHPGWLQRPHATINDKIANAERLEQRGLTRTIWVDSVDGALHMSLNPLPNSVYIVDTQGTVVYKSTWNVPTEVDAVLRSLNDSGSGSVQAPSNYCGDPSRYYARRDMMAYIMRIVAVGGPDALIDFVVNEMFEDDADEATGECVNEVVADAAPMQ